MYNYVNSKKVKDKIRIVEGWTKNIDKLNPDNETVKILKDRIKKKRSKTNQRTRRVPSTTQYVIKRRDFSPDPISKKVRRDIRITGNTKKPRVLS